MEETRKKLEDFFDEMVKNMKYFKRKSYEQFFKDTYEKYRDLMSAAEAAQLKDYMTSVVDYGTASVLAGQSYTAAGKTGTAEYSSDEEKDHSWFIGMSNVDNPELVISIIIESSDGSASAVNMAKQIFDAYYY